MTDDELAEIERRIDAATPGPWACRPTDVDGELREAVVAKSAGNDTVADDVGLEDAIFIAHAREDVLRLVAEVRRLRTLLVIATCGECGYFEKPLCMHPDIEFARDAHGILGAVGDGKSAPPNWCPLRGRR